LLIVSPDSQASACPLSGRNSTYLAVRICGATSVPYTVHINIPLNFGGAIDDTCASAAIKEGAISCHFSDSGQKVAINQRATTEASWRGAEGPMAAGQYQDRLTVTVSVKP
jgi:hypothetical protein